jgi:hypothetical protein
MSVATLSTESLSGMAPELLAELANDAAKQAEQRAKTTAEAALLAGKALAAAKEQIPHGQWEQWLSDNWNYHQSLARRYMQISKRYSGSVLENRSVRSLLAEMSEPSDEATDAPKQQSLHAAESYDAPIEVTAREPETPDKQPSVKVKESKPKQRVTSFILAERLDEDRSKIMELAGEYLSHQKLQSFVQMLQSLLVDIQQEFAE